MIDPDGMRGVFEEIARKAEGRDASRPERVGEAGAKKAEETPLPHSPARAPEEFPEHPLKTFAVVLRGEVAGGFVAVAGMWLAWPLLLWGAGAIGVDVPGGDVLASVWKYSAIFVGCLCLVAVLGLCAEVVVWKWLDRCRLFEERRAAGEGIEHLAGMLLEAEREARDGGELAEDERTLALARAGGRSLLIARGASGRSSRSSPPPASGARGATETSLCAGTART